MKTPQKKRQLHNDFEQIKTVSWSNHSYPHGVIKPVCGRQTFP